MSVLSKLPVMLSDIDEVDIRYENGCIYMIKHKTDDTKEFYIGSSYDFKYRCLRHKSNSNNQSKKYNYKVYKYIRENGGWNEWKMILLYNYPCKNKYQLELEEKRAVKEYKSTLNTQIPRRTHQEYRKDNKEKIALYRKDNKEKIAQLKKEWYNDNKEKLLQQQKEYYKNNKKKISQYHKERYQKIRKNNT